MVNKQKQKSKCEKEKYGKNGVACDQRIFSDDTYKKLSSSSFFMRQSEIFLSFIGFFQFFN